MLFGPANFDVRLIGTHLLNYKVQSQAGGLVIQSNDTIGNQGVNIGGVNTQNNVKNRFNLSVGYKDGPVALNAQWRFYGAAHRTQVPGIIYVDNDVPSISYIDLTLGYTIAGIETFLTANNLFDKQPPIVVGGGQPGQQYPTNVNVYDVIGRYYTAGFRFKF